MTNMFAVLTEEKNTALYRVMQHSVRVIERLWADRIAHGCYDNQDLRSMSLDALEIMVELTSAPYADEAKPEVTYLSDCARIGLFTDCETCRNGNSHV